VTTTFRLRKATFRSTFKQWPCLIRQSIFCSRHMCLNMYSPPQGAQRDLSSTCTRWTHVLTSTIALRLDTSSFDSRISCRQHASVFNFGWDLTDQLCDAGFTTTVLVTREYFEMLNQSTSAPASNGDGFDVEELVIAVRPQSLTPVTDSNVSRVFGFLPAFHYATWECIKPN